VNSINPFRPAGQKTVAFEVVEALGDAPDYHALPVGNAGNIGAHWVGYSEAACVQTGACAYCAGRCPFHTGRLATRRPVMVGYQASGAAPIVRGRVVENPETVATAIRIGNPASWELALNAQRESGGWFAECTDEEIVSAQKLLAQTEGIFCEPASAISIAGVLRDIADGRMPGEGSTIVCTLTGHGLKDPDTAIAHCVKPLTVEAELSQIERVIHAHLGGH
jgi:threonine synthase